MEVTMNINNQPPNFLSPINSSAARVIENVAENFLIKVNCL